MYSRRTVNRLLPAPQSKRALILRGIAWNSVYHVFAIVAGFVSMLVLARVLSPAEYGHVSGASGWLGLFGALGCQGFLAQSLQLSDHEEPDWDLHWSACWCIQLPLCLAANAMAGVMWFIPAYRTLAPLLHLASVALLLSLPDQLVGKMLERRFDFRRLQIFFTMSLVVGTSTMLLLAPRLGAFGVILGGSVCNLLPSSLYLFFVLRWRPRHWWRWPDWGRYRPALAFGAQQNVSNLMQAAKKHRRSRHFAGLSGIQLDGTH
jgi:O-antigen/teichoic acid export membrane protein